MPLHVAAQRKPALEPPGRRAGRVSRGNHETAPRSEPHMAGGGIPGGIARFLWATFCAVDLGPSVALDTALAPVDLLVWLLSDNGAPWPY